MESKTYPGRIEALPSDGVVGPVDQVEQPSVFGLLPSNAPNRIECFRRFLLRLLGLGWLSAAPSGHDPPGFDLVGGVLLGDRDTAAAPERCQGRI